LKIVMHGRPLLLALAWASCLPFGGCGSHSGGGHDVAGGTDASAPLNAAGETPSWSAVARPGSLILTVGDAAPITVKPAVAKHSKAGASWSGDLPGHAGTLALEVTAKVCRDGETGLTYPLTAVASVQGRRYAGCAAPPGQGLGPRA
jgi:uncharacterized membrane protein